MALDPRDLQLIEHVIKTLIQSGGGLVQSMNNMTNATTQASKTTTTATESLVKSKNDESAASVAFSKRVSKTASNFNQFDKVLNELITSSSTGATKLNNVAKAYELARASMMDSADATYKTWESYNTVFPNILSKNLKEINSSLQDKLKTFEDVLKFDEYVAAQNKFLSSFEHNNKQLNEDTIKLLANVQELGGALGEDYIKMFPKKTVAAFEEYLKLQANGADDTTLKAASAKITQAFAKTSRVAANSTFYTNRMYKEFTGLTNAVRMTAGDLSKVNKQIGPFATALTDGMGKFGQLLQTGLKRGFDEEAISEIKAVGGKAIKAQVAAALIKVGTTATNELISSIKGQIITGLEPAYLSAVSMFTTAEKLRNVQYEYMTTLQTMSGGAKEYTEALENGSNTFLKLTAYDGERSLKLNAASLKLANTFEHTRVNANNAAQSSLRFSKQMQIQSKYLGTSFEETQAFLESLAEADEVQQSLTGTLKKQKATIATDTAAMVAHAQAIGLSKTRAQEFAKTLLVGSKTRSEKAELAGSMSQLVGRFGKQLTDEQRKVINTFVASGGSDKYMSDAERKLLPQAVQALGAEVQAQKNVQLDLISKTENLSGDMSAQRNSIISSADNQIKAIDELITAFTSNSSVVSSEFGKILKTDTARMEATALSPEVTAQMDAEIANTKATTELTTGVNKLEEAIMWMHGAIKGTEGSTLGAIGTGIADIFTTAAGVTLATKGLPAVTGAASKAIPAVTSAASKAIPAAANIGRAALTGGGAVLSNPMTGAALGAGAVGYGVGTLAYNNSETVRDIGAYVMEDLGVGKVIANIFDSEAAAAIETAEQYKKSAPIAPPTKDDTRSKTEKTSAEKSTESLQLVNDQLNQLINATQNVNKTSGNQVSSLEKFIELYTTVEQERIRAAGLEKFLNPAS